MIATELVQRYSQGESKSALARRYGISWDKVASILVHMDAAGPTCKRCEILLRFDPGQDGFCGECWEEVGNVDLVSQSAPRSDHPVLPDLSTFTARL
jgi:hypothetical protein